ncbi:MAG: COX15/CtaA family protein [Pirellulales bacterium]|nr:COX15/CtaA family protein [Pirellulales bacterium]
MNDRPAQLDSPWPHRLAVALVTVTFPLIWLGGLVTTHNAGMAVPDWPSTYGYNLFAYPWQTWLFGPFDLLVEHGHRLLGALAGLVTIGLLVAIWRGESRRWVRGLGVLALVGVIGQGLLGGLRVIQDARELAKIHGCVGPAFFALAVALAVITSRRWRKAAPLPAGRAAVGTRTLAWTITLLAYLQLVLGAHLRHLPIGFEWPAFRVVLWFHLVLAGALVALPIMFLVRCHWAHPDRVAVSRPAGLLASLVGVQVALGCATWVTNYGFPAWLQGWSSAAGYTIISESMLQSLVTTAHVAVGSLILATALVAALRSVRWLPAGESVAVASAANARATSTNAPHTRPTVILAGRPNAIGS